MISDNRSLVSYTTAKACSIVGKLLKVIWMTFDCWYHSVLLSRRRQNIMLIAEQMYLLSSFKKVIQTGTINTVLRLD